MCLLMLWMERVKICAYASLLAEARWCVCVCALNSVSREYPLSILCAARFCVASRHEIGWVAPPWVVGTSKRHDVTLLCCGCRIVVALLVC